MPDSTFISTYWLKRPSLVRTGILRGDASRSKYRPHQGEREKARRLARQC